MMWRIIQPRRMISTEAYDWREYLHNSLHHAKAEFNNCFTIHSRPRAGRLKHSKQVANEDAADFTELLYILITRTWLVSLQSLVERCTSIAEVQGSNPVQLTLNFFRLSFRNCKSCVYNCDDPLSFNSSPHSSHIWFSYIHN